MTDRKEPAVVPKAEEGGTLSLELGDVTGTQSVVANDVQHSLPAGAVARAAANQFSLPENVPWSLHNDRGAWLDDETPIGDQVTPGERLWVSPKSHLG
ncbi:MAG: hypothetical protein RIC12_01520 [Pirellulales bacterium]